MGPTGKVNVSNGPPVGLIVRFNVSNGPPMGLWSASFYPFHCWPTPPYVVRTEINVRREASQPLYTLGYCQPAPRPSFPFHCWSVIPARCWMSLMSVML